MKHSLSSGSRLQSSTRPMCALSFASLHPFPCPPCSTTAPPLYCLTSDTFVRFPFSCHFVLTFLVPTSSREASLMALWRWIRSSGLSSISLRLGPARLALKKPPLRCCCRRVSSCSLFFGSCLLVLAHNLRCRGSRKGGDLLHRRGHIVTGNR